MSLIYINWNVDPEIFSIGNVAIRWYGLLFASAFIISYVILKKIFIKENVSIELLDKLSMYIAIGTILGARLGHCLFYEPDYYFANPVEIIKIWHGGLASHGATIGIIISIILFSIYEKKEFLWTFDRISIVAPIAGAFIRIGNLMNSEIYGIKTSLPWGFIFAKTDIMNEPHHPTQIYEALGYIIIFIIIFYIFSKTQSFLSKPGKIGGYSLVLIFSLRFIIEFIKENQVSFEDNLYLNMGQLLSIPFIIIGLYLIFRKTKNNNYDNKSEETSI